MRFPRRAQPPLLLTVGLTLALGAVACQSSGGADDGGRGPEDGALATGGAGQGTGGKGTGGLATGGLATGGLATGGLATGGVATGGRASGGSETGGRATGGSATAGRDGQGGRSATGGTMVATGGSGGTTAGMDPCGRPLNVAVPSGYGKLVWHDEFDADGAPSSANWGYEQGFARNEELQWYQAANAAVSGGRLVITAKRETKANPNYKAGSSDWKTSRKDAEYTSSSLTTSGKQSWQYGRFEMCAKIPVDNGMWPAWWTLGVSGEWPTNGEVDIMEFYKGKILANFACGTNTRWQAKWDSVTKAVNASWASSYHFWRMDWDSTKIDIYVDDTLLNTAKLSDLLNADGTSPFKQKAYMIVNLALGGQNGGDPSGTTFPKLYEIDYLRVFQ